MTANRGFAIVAVAMAATFTIMALLAAPIWSYGFAIAVLGGVAAALNSSLPAATDPDPPALESVVNVAGAVAVGGFAVAAAVATGNAVFGIVGVAAAVALLLALRVAR